MIDLAKLKLGKLPFTRDRRDLLLKNYVNAQRILDSPAIPAALDWFNRTAVGGVATGYDTDPLYNDVAGCCVLSGIGHHGRLVGQLVGDVGLQAIDATDVASQYQDLTGYNPTTGENDTGLVIRDVLKLAVNRGVFGRQALAFARVDYSDPVQRQIANVLGCGTIDGYALPRAGFDCRDDAGRFVWDIPAGGWPSGEGPGSLGGHCIFGHSADVCGVGDTWGIRAWMSHTWKLECQDESWILLWPQWAAHAPNGFALDDLLADARARGGQ